MEQELEKIEEQDVNAIIEIDEVLLDILAVFVVSVGLLCACLLLAAAS